ncbi:glycerol-3-phosphate acyltransferase 2 [Ktedonobacter sp. SOSP1-85]|uniref:glycerol-3-phosphate 1-O-acyltransferase PlsY n=1 Tax=Ktedonobacter sp. SOSP1-85 TaxID=2778367 RepID=UPI0019163C23|nr:glycerol-3-phosphate 1-O-acyltransferase PlsY [Ktedonobacter sp. SOSP1-85]GHO75632.1 glycerol-3-phosphate acyltransferase 2 [Ktedonobacter sp. SOSP1-85]
MPGIIISVILSALIAYLWGSIPTGYWMGKILRGKDFDIRDHGSKKIGATNVQRTLGNGPAAIVFLIDLSKGVGPTLLALLVPALNAGGWGPAIAGILALLGHCYPVFIGFKGGRGVLTGGGALLVISPTIFLICLIVTVGTIILSRYVSLGSVLGSACTIICGIIFFLISQGNPHIFAHVTIQQLLFLIISPALVLIFHADNIKRLLSGTERKLGQKVDTTPNTN